MQGGHTQGICCIQGFLVPEKKFGQKMEFFGLSVKKDPPTVEK